DKTPLARARTAVLTKATDPSGIQRVSDAVDTLENIAAVRNSLLQHSGTEHRGAQALIDLGIGYPVLDWAQAWITVQARMIDALAVMREELQLAQGATP